MLSPVVLVLTLVALAVVPQSALTGRVASLLTAQSTSSEPHRHGIHQEVVGGSGKGPAGKKHGARDFDDVDDRKVRAHWALLVAGSSGWYNYRHQSDVCHAYQVMKSGGLLPPNIVVMMYDDIAADYQNPHPGKVFNRPGGPDVYHGIQIDYRGEDVNSQTFLAVLEGNKTAVANKGSGKVIASGARDRIFLFYSDHGSPGVLGMPTGNFLYADELMGALRRKYKRGGFREAVLYIEACESGSMFEGLLSSDLPVYATTAANSLESSWGTYCPGMDIEPIAGMDTCLGDLYSVAWMEDSEMEDSREETLQAQYKLVTARTSNNFTYNMGSHVMKYGRLSIQDEHTGSYIGVHTAGAPATEVVPALSPAALSACTQRLRRVLSASSLPPDAQAKVLSDAQQRRSCDALMWQTVPQRDADLVPLKQRVHKATSEHERAKAQEQYLAAVSQRAKVDEAMQQAAVQLLLMSETSPVLLKSMGATTSQVFMAYGGATGTTSSSSSNKLRPGARFVEQVVHGHMADRAGGSGSRPLVDSWDCLRAMVAAYGRVCGPMDQYAMRHTRMLANLCNAGVAPHHLEKALAATGQCSEQQPAAADA